MKPKPPKYEYDKTYKVTIVYEKGEYPPDDREFFYKQGSEMEEEEMKIKNKASKIKHWFQEKLR